MALRNPYSEYARRGDENTLNRDALIQALEDSPDQPTPMPMQARPRTPVRTPQQTRDMLSGPGGQTQIETDDRDPSGVFTTPPPSPASGNPFSGDRWQDERQGDGYSPTPAGGDSPGTSTAPSHRYNPQRGTELVDAYDDPYQRRGGYGGMEPKRKAISEGLLSSGEPYTMVSGAFGMLDSYMRRRAESAPTDFNIADAREIISQAHKDAFGADIDPAYLDQIIRGQGWEDGDRYFGDASMRYVLDAFDQQSGGGLSRPRTETDTEAPPATSAPATTATPGAGAPGGLPFEGFDFGAQDAGHERANSAKYSYAAAVREAPPLADTSKAGYEAWVREHIAPRMEADGHRITAFEGDRFKVESTSGSGWVDGLRGAGGDRPGFAWQPDDVSGGTAGGEMGDAPTDIAGAYAWLKANANPRMSRAEMESIAAKAFRNVPGFEKAYAGDVVINGKKLDLITDFEGANPQWSDNLNFVPLHGGGAPASASWSGTNTGLNLAPGVSLAAPLGNSDAHAQIQAAIRRLLNDEYTRDELLEALG
jgi:hypothetical protein